MDQMNLKRYTKPGPARRLARALDKLITVCQEWLEGHDQPAAKWTAMAVILASLAYVAIHLFIAAARI